MIKNRVSQVMGYRKLQIADVARIAKLRYDTVANLYYDRAARLDLATLDKLCFALECNTDDLFKYIPEDV